MIKLAANLTMLFNELDFMRRFDAAAKAGFRGVEFLFPYDYPADQIAGELKRNQLELVLHNLPAGSWSKGERGIACLPDRIAEFEEGVVQSIHYAKALGVKQLNCLAGIAPDTVDRREAHETFVRNVSFAAEKLKAEGIRLLIEPINTFDIPGFFLYGTRQALDIIRQTGSGNVFLQYDIYHMQRMEGELANTIKTNFPLIKHVQLADYPGRNEPGTGEINYRYLFSLLDELGYDGWVGCEYKPKAGTKAGLEWRSTHGLKIT